MLAETMATPLAVFRNPAWTPVQQATLLRLYTGELLAGQGAFAAPLATLTPQARATMQVVYERLGVLMMRGGVQLDREMARHWFGWIDLVRQLRGLQVPP